MKRTVGKPGRRARRQSLHLENLRLSEKVANLREFAKAVRDCHDCTSLGEPHAEVTDCWRCFAEHVLKSRRAA